MDKGEIKAAAIHEMGVRVDDLLEATLIEQYRNEGASSALAAAVKKVGELSVICDKEMDEGLFDLATAKVIKKYVTRALAVVDTMAKTAENHRLLVTGKAKGLEAVVAELDNTKKVELGKAEHRQKVVEESRPKPPPPEPPPPIVPAAKKLTKKRATKKKAAGKPRTRAANSR
jgi:hypothetical protein